MYERPRKFSGKQWQKLLKNMSEKHMAKCVHIRAKAIKGERKNEF